MVYVPADVQMFTLLSTPNVSLHHIYFTTLNSPKRSMLSGATEWSRYSFSCALSGTSHHYVVDTRICYEFLQEATTSQLLAALCLESSNAVCAWSCSSHGYPD